jgi:hypothetical protein
MRPRKSLTWILRAAGVFALTASAATTAGCGSEEDDRPKDWSYIYPAIIEPSCATASCHSKFAAKSGVDLSNIDEAYDQMTLRKFVVPGQPLQSGLVALLNAAGVRRMPPDFALPQVDISLIYNWILGGALYEGVGPTAPTP